MEVQAAKLIGAGIAVLPLLGVGVGLGTLFGNVIGVLGRNPSAADAAKGSAFLYFALIEAAGLFALGVAFMILYS